MFSLFTSKPVEDKKTQAREAFEKVAALRSDSRETRSVRLRMGLLCRAHMDKTFIDGALKTSEWQDIAAAAIARGQDTPAPPVPDLYQTVGSGTGEVTVYLPEEIVGEFFILGSRYQQAEIGAEQVIQAAQNIADQFFRFELRMDETFEVLKFLRDELAGVEPTDEAESEPSGQ